MGSSWYVSPALVPQKHSDSLIPSYEILQNFWLGWLLTYNPVIFVLRNVIPSYLSPRFHHKDPLSILFDIVSSDLTTSWFHQNNSWTITVRNRIFHNQTVMRSLSTHCNVTFKIMGNFVFLNYCIGLLDYQNTFSQVFVNFIHHYQWKGSICGPDSWFAIKCD